MQVTIRASGEVGSIMSADASEEVGSAHPSHRWQNALLCWANIDDSSVPERQRHYGAHVLSEESEENPRANSSSWTTSKKFSLWISKGKLRNPMTANVEKSQDVFWRPAMKMPPPKNSFRLFHFPWKTACRRNTICCLTSGARRCLRLGWSAPVVKIQKSSKVVKVEGEKSKTFTVTLDSGKNTKIDCTYANFDFGNRKLQAGRQPLIDEDHPLRAVTHPPSTMSNMSGSGKGCPGLPAPDDHEVNKFSHRSKLDSHFNSEIGEKALNPQGVRVLCPSQGAYHQERNNEYTQLHAQVQHKEKMRRMKRRLQKLTGRLSTCGAGVFVGILTEGIRGSVQSSRSDRRFYGIACQSSFRFRENETRLTEQGRSVIGSSSAKEIVRRNKARSLTEVSLRDSFKGSRNSSSAVFLYQNTKLLESWYAGTFEVRRAISALESENDTNDVVVLNIKISSLLQRSMFPIYGVECLFHVIGNPRCQAINQSETIETRPYQAEN
ncbi:hypothetical protein GG344DRAFT_71152 [Lentinula edodes]|nr:hypothetical protein GG344DRAFT_71152 [Lentinula edodes]